MTDDCRKVAEEIVNFELTQTGWECGEDIVCLNGKPIGSTITKDSKEFDRWLPALKEMLEDKIAQALASREKKGWNDALDEFLKLTEKNAFDNCEVDKFSLEEETEKLRKP